MKLATWIGVLAMVCAACGSKGTRPFGDDPSSGGASADAGAAAATDNGSLGTPEPEGDAGACPNVDVLFVIDNSGSMSDKQTRLANSYPGFASAIVSRLPRARSVHVGVVSTSEYYAGAPQGCLVKRTEGPLSSNRACIAAPYLVSSDPAFSSAFPCVAQLGSGGDDDEKPIRGMLGALDPANNAPSACNDGFSRQDALLIVVLITDEDDVRDADCNPQTFSGTCGSGGTPQEWHQKLVALKGGHPENVVVLSLVSRKAGDCSNTVTSNVLAFTHAFGGAGYVGDVCAQSYDSFFAAALPVVDRACTTFVPPK